MIVNNDFQHLSISSPYWENEIISVTFLGFSFCWQMLKTFGVWFSSVNTSLSFFLLPPFRLLRSLIGLKRVIINAAHFLVMKNRDFYRFYQTEAFLETVRWDVDIVTSLNIGEKKGSACKAFSCLRRISVFMSLGWQASHSGCFASAHFNRIGPSRTKV